jgi:hypothetical protein
MSPDTPQTPRPPEAAIPATAPDWDNLLESPASQALLERLISEAQAELKHPPGADPDRSDA